MANYLYLCTTFCINRNPSMKHFTYSPTLLFTCLVAGLMAFSSCQSSKYKNASSKRIADEELAEQLLQKARIALSHQDYDEARETVKLMRDTCRYAISGREQGILLLDSIELLQAMNDTSVTDQELRVEFYRKKLEHDRKNQHIAE